MVVLQAALFKEKGGEEIFNCSVGFYGYFRYESLHAYKKNLSETERKI